MFSICFVSVQFVSSIACVMLACVHPLCINHHDSGGLANHVDKKTRRTDGHPGGGPAEMGGDARLRGRCATGRRTGESGVSPKAPTTPTQLTSPPSIRYSQRRGFSLASTHIFIMFQSASCRLFSLLVMYMFRSVCVCVLCEFVEGMRVRVRNSVLCNQHSPVVAGRSTHNAHLPLIHSLLAVRRTL